VRREPLGVVVVIAPWNALQVLSAFRYAPALAANCTVVLKPGVSRTGGTAPVYGA